MGPLRWLGEHWGSFAGIALVVVAIAVLRWALLRPSGERKLSTEQRLPRLVGLLAATVAGVVLVVILLPVGDSLRGQLLGLIGVAIMAILAMASTTFVANVMAGVMLRLVKSFRPGDFVHVAEHVGRVTDRGLFHIEIQTEDGDLATLPNLFIATHPVTVVRSSGTIVSATVSLGYDVHRGAVEEALASAAASTELADPFVQILDLGDFSVTYRVAGRLENVKALLTSRSRLRAAMMDALHAADIEIVSPTFMNQRRLADGARTLPPPQRQRQATSDEGADKPLPEAMIFDKADKAEELEQLREVAAALEARIESTEATAKGADDEERARLETRQDRLQRRLARLRDRIAELEGEREAT